MNTEPPSAHGKHDSHASHFAALWAPAFPLQALLRARPEWGGLAVVLIAAKTPKAPVLFCNRPARQAGIEPGMPLSQAQARCPAVRVALPSEEAELSAGAVLLEAAFGASAFVEKTGPGLCTVEFKGERLPDPAGLAPMLRARLGALGLEVQLGFAPNAGLALLAARSAHDVLIISGAEALSELPVECLEPSPSAAGHLRQWGIRTLGALRALGEGPLAERLGPEGRALFAKAAGKAERPLRCVAPPERFEEGMDFEQEIESLEPLLFILRRFVEQLARRLEACGRVALELRLRLGFAGGTQAVEEYARTFQVPSPTSQVEVLFRMLTTHLENFRAEQPIARLHLQAVPGPPARQQFELFESALRDPNQFYETLARLTALLGEGRIGVPALEPGHRPDAFRLLTADFTAAPRAAAGDSEAAWPAGLALHRFRPPLPARVDLGELGGTGGCGRRPVFLQCPVLEGKIGAAHGPLPCSGDWWNGRRWSRREWDVQLDGGPLARLYEEDGAWFLEGFYD